MKKPMWGGKRKGSGAKKGEPKESLNLRVPANYKRHLVKLVRDEIEKLNEKNK